MSASRGRTVVVLRALGLGDLLTALPALRALADAYPGHRRILLTRGDLEPLAALSGTVHEVVPADGLARVAVPDRPDVAVNLHGTGPQSHRALSRAAPERLIAFSNPDVSETLGFPEWRDDEHEVRRWCRLLRESGIPADPSRLELPAPPGRSAPDGVRGATLVHPGAASPARRWPASRWAAVAAGERRSGRTVVLSAGPGEVALASAVAREAGLAPEAVLETRGDVLALARAVAVAGRVLCGDTGVAHLATAYGRPSVTLFGPTPPSRWGPPPDRPQHIALWAGTTGDPHAARADAGLLRIRVEDVLGAVARLERDAALLSR